MRILLACSGRFVPLAISNALTIRSAKRSLAPCLRFALLEEAEALLRKIPVEPAINEGIQVLATPVLVIEVVRVLPQVDCQQARVSMGLRAIRARCRQDSHLLAAIRCQPKPPAAQVRCTCQGELVGEVREVTEHAN